MARHTSSIRDRLGLIVIAGVVLAVLLTSSLAAWRDTTQRIRDKEAELIAIADALAATLAVPVMNGRAADAARALSAIGRMPTIRYARVVDQRGGVLAQFGIGIVVAHEGIERARLGNVGLIEALWIKDHALSVPVISGGRQVGRLDIVADVSTLGTAFRQTLETALLTAMLAAGLGLVLALPLLNLVTRPILTLTETMRRVHSTGDFSIAVPRCGDDEAGLLVDAFNDMLREIRTRDERLAQHRAILEQEVRERTSELQVAKQVAEAASSAKSDFLASMSHEIRTPMHGMLAMTELLQSTSLDTRQQRFADMIQKSGRSLLAIVNDVLDLSKIEAGRMELEAVPVAPSVIADDVVQLFHERASGKGLALLATCAADVPAWISGDPVRLNQVLANLVSNAIKFTAEGSVTVELAMSADRKALLMSVRDTGIGIPGESLERIFDAFSQAEDSTTRRFGGTGIGLTICRRLIMAMGGTITIESELGKGSAFICSIPVVEVAAPAPQTSDSPTDAAISLAGIRVLAADDNAVNRAVIEGTLTRLGVEVEFAEDGEAAVAAFKRGRFDVVLMDCSMPVLDGFGASRRIREWERETGGTPIPIVALTAHVIGSTAERWREAGMSGYLAKPFTLAQIAATLAQWTTPTAGSRASDTGSPAASAAIAPAASAPAVIDAEVLGQILAMDKGGKLIGRLLALYRQQVPLILERLRIAIAAGDRAETAAQGHALKSASVSLGARHVAALADRIERQAQLESVLPGKAQIEEIEAAFSLADEGLARVLAGQTRASTAA